MPREPQTEDEAHERLHEDDDENRFSQDDDDLAGRSWPGMTSITEAGDVVFEEAEQVDEVDLSQRPGQA